MGNGERKDVVDIGPVRMKSSCKRRWRWQTPARGRLVFSSAWLQGRELPRREGDSHFERGEETGY